MKGMVNTIMRRGYEGTSNTRQGEISNSRESSGNSAENTLLSNQKLPEPLKRYATSFQDIKTKATSFSSAADQQKLSECFNALKQDFTKTSEWTTDQSPAQTVEWDKAIDHIAAYIKEIDHLFKKK